MTAVTPATVGAVLICHWWNRSWGTMTRRDVWLERLPDGRFLIRWHGGAWTDRDGRYTARRPEVAIAVLRALLVPDQPWKEISRAHHRRPPDATPADPR